MSELSHHGCNHAALQHVFMSDDIRDLCESVSLRGGLLTPCTCVHALQSHMTCLMPSFMIYKFVNHSNSPSSLGLSFTHSLPCSLTRASTHPLPCSLAHSLTHSTSVLPQDQVSTALSTSQHDILVWLSPFQQFSTSK